MRKERSSILPASYMRVAAGVDESETSGSDVGSEEEDDADQHDRFGEDNEDPWQDEASGTEASSGEERTSSSRRPLRRAEAAADTAARA